MSNKIFALISLAIVLVVSLTVGTAATVAQGGPERIQPPPGTPTPPAAIMVDLCTCSNNDAGNAGLVPGGVQVELYLPDPLTIGVRVRKMNDDQFVVTQVYFEDYPFWIGVDEVIDGPGTAYYAYGAPPDLPAGNNCPVRPFVTSFNVVPVSPAPQNGIGQPADEWMEARLNTPDSTHALIAVLTHFSRVGFHVQGFANGGYETFVTCAVPPAPTPTPTPTPPPTGIIGDPEPEAQTKWFYMPIMRR